MAPSISAWQVLGSVAVYKGIEIMGKAAHRALWSKERSGEAGHLPSELVGQFKVSDDHVKGARSSPSAPGLQVVHLHPWPLKAIPGKPGICHPSDGSLSGKHTQLTQDVPGNRAAPGPFRRKGM